MLRYNVEELILVLSALFLNGFVDKREALLDASDLVA